MTNPLKSVGAFLQEERNRRGLTLEEISSHTKINVRFLDALEQGDYSVLPADAFVRGFLRAYARQIGINPEEVMARLDQLGEAEQAKRSTPPPERQPRVSGQASSKKLVGVVSLTVIVVVIAVAFTMYRVFTGQPTPGKREVTQLSEQVAHPQVDAVQPIGGGEPIQAEPPVPARPLAPQAGPKPVGYEKTYAFRLDSTAAVLEPATAPLRLSITAADETWVELSIDSGESEERVKLDPGTTKTWLAKHKFVLTLGNMKGTRIALNDRILSLPFNESNVLRNYTLTREMLQ